MLPRRNWSVNTVQHRGHRVFRSRRPRAVGEVALALCLLLSPIAGAEENGFGKLWSDLKHAFQSATAHGEQGEDPAVSEVPSDPSAAEQIPKPAAKPAPPRRSQKVATVQGNLETLGYEPGPVDGISGSRTRSAIRAYRKDHKLVQGVGIDEALLASLQSELAARKAGSNMSGTAKRASQRAKSVDSPNQDASHERRALSTKVRGFEFRGMRLGDSVGRIRSIFPEARISSDERVYGGRPVVESYFGIVEEQGLSLRFSRGKRLYRLNSAQLIERPVSAAAVRAKFVEKYGQPDFEEALDDEGSAARLNWGLREGSGGAGMQLTVLSETEKNVTRISIRLWDDAAAQRNVASWSQAIKDPASVPAGADEVNL